MCVIEFEPCNVWNERRMTARKGHRCSICTTVIHPGQVYTGHFSLDEAGLCAAKVCPACQEARHDFAEAHEGEYGPSYCQPPGFVSVVEDCIAEGDDESEQKWKLMLAAIEARRNTVREERT